MTLMLCHLSLLSFIVIVPTINALGTGNIGCFVDIGEQSDRKTDIVIYSHNKVTAFKQRHSIQTKDFHEYANFTTAGKVQSVSAMDWTKNGVADLFVVTETLNNFQLTVWENNQNVFENNPSTIDLAEKHVLILDANGDFIPDVFGKKYVSPPQTEQTEGFWFGARTAQTTTFSEFVPLGIDKDNIDMKTVSFIDLDQDCRADLVYITIQPREVKMISAVNFADAAQRNARTLLLLNDTYQSRMYFADINKDGAMDIIIPTKKNVLQLFVQDNEHCLGFKQLCSQSVAVAFKPNTGIPLTLADAPKGFELNQDLPVIVQDINMDSKINIVAVLAHSDGRRQVYVTTIPDSDVAVAEATQIRHDANIGNLFEDKKIKDVAFFHSGEFPLGLHFLIQREDDSFGWIDLQPLLNDNGYGFLSICPLNDVTPALKRYGGTMPGVTVKAFFRSRNGKEIFLNSGTLYQTNTGNHLLPFVVFGLGDPDSYIEKLVIGYSIYERDHTHIQPGVPPNSQLVLFAYDQWRLETFLAPYITAPILAMIIAVVMTILGGIWLYLEIQEKKSATHDQLKGSTTANNFFF